MKNSHKYLTIGSIGVMAVLGWLTGVVLSAPAYVPTESSGQSEMSLLKGDLTNYIAENFKKQRAGGTLVDIAVQQPVTHENGAVDFDYILAFNEPVNGEDTTSWIQATATLQRTSHKLPLTPGSWKVVKVATQKETVTYATAPTITPTKDDGK